MCGLQTNPVAPVLSIVARLPTSLLCLMSLTGLTMQLFLVGYFVVVFLLGVNATVIFLKFLKHFEDPRPPDGGKGHCRWMVCSGGANGEATTSTWTHPHETWTHPHEQQDLLLPLFAHLRCSSVQYN
jgi:hypothetical protein